MAFGLVWAELLTADILVAGLLAIGLAAALAGAWISSRLCPTLSGAFLALAYLAKAVALPISVLMLLLVAIRSLRLGNDFRRVAMATLLTGIGFAVVAVPWVAALSSHHERLTFSNSGPINHATRGPSPGNRTLYQIIENVEPEPGSKDLIREREQYRAGRALGELLAGKPAVGTLWADATAYEAGVFAAFLLDIPVVLLPDELSERSIARPARSVLVTTRSTAGHESADPGWKPAGFSASSSIVLSEKHILEIWTPDTP